MMNQLQIFENEEFGKVRVVNIDGEPWLVGKDVAEVLGYKDITHTILDRVDEEDRINSKTQGQNAPEFGQRGTWLINESGLYSLVMSSKLPHAKRFRRWVTSKVLPAIRKTGMYVPMSEDDLLNRAFLIATKRIEEANNRINLLQNTVAEQNVQIGEYKPKAEYLDKILKSKNCMPVTLIAKDYGYSTVKFNQLLHSLGIQYKRGSTWVLYSKYQGEGYTHITSFEYSLKDGGFGTSNTMQWTQRGRKFLYFLLKDNGIIPMIERIIA